MFSIFSTVWVLFNKNLDKINYKYVIYLDFKSLFFGFKITRENKDLKYGSVDCDSTGINYNSEYRETIIIKYILFNRTFYRDIWFNKTKIIIKTPI